MPVIRASRDFNIVERQDETVVVKFRFGRRAYEIPMSSIKSMIGHPQGSAPLAWSRRFWDGSWNASADDKLQEVDPVDLNHSQQRYS
jgi:hypothetical protein